MSWSRIAMRRKGFGVQRRAQEPVSVIVVPPAVSAREAVSQCRPAQ
ncbi:hypothetical protein [Allokutzneria sp. NRRL B-24872]|nr:hypothetical protein [Allokutzneria sp. NRRL B-24872]